MDQILQTEESLHDLISLVVCGDYEFIIRERNGDFSLQIQFDACDNLAYDNIAAVERQYCRIWPLQVTMCDSEVIRTAWKAAEAATMHELEEQFTFCGEMIYSPHMNVKRLVALRKEEDASETRVPVDGHEPSRFGSPMEV